MARLLSRSLILGLTLCLGCSYVFDHAAPELPLVGGAPDPATLPRLNRAPVDRSWIVSGADGTPWAVLLEGHRWRLVQLAPPAAEQDVPGDLVQLAGNALYAQTRGSGLTVHVPGAASAVKFAVPDGAFSIVAGPLSAFAWFGQGAAYYELLHQDGSSPRRLALPPGVDAQQPGASGAQLFTADERYFLERGADGRLIARDTAGDGDVDLGVRSGALAPTSDGAVWSCAADGLARLVPAGASVELRDDQCSELIALDGELVYYRRGGSVWRASASTRDRARVTDLPDGARAIAFAAGSGRVAYSTDPEERYVLGAGDGWLSGWRFMERGLAAQFSTDETRLYWREHAADGDGIGELMAADLSTRGVQSLARNARKFAELADGRVLAEANQAVVGATSRIIVIDEARGHAQLVLDSASYFTRIPGSDDILVGVVGAYTLPEHDVVRVTIPTPR